MKDTQPHLASPWSEQAETVAGDFGVNSRIGRSDSEVEALRRQNGSNSFGGSPPVSYARIFFRQFESPLIVILCIALIITLFLHEWLDSSIIFLAVAVNACLGFYQEFKAERAIADLTSYITERTRVIRAGYEREIDAATLVVGDIIHLTQGMRVPADARIITATALYVDEAILTGESMPVSKKHDTLPLSTMLAERTNMLYGGTLVVDGTTLAIVTATGPQTEIGKLAQLVTETEREKTPLQKAVAAIAWVIAGAVTVIVTLLFGLGISQGIPLIDMLLISIAVIVGAVPEALPIGLTAVLAVGVERIARRKGIIRNLTAAETLGSTTVIMTDKTGTLTEAKMELADVVLTDELRGVMPTERQLITELKPEARELVRLALTNTDVVIENPTDNPNDWRISGHALEVNLVRAAARLGISVVNEHVQDTSRFVVPFSSTHKFSVSEITADLSSVGGYPKPERYWIVVGAPDILLSRSTAVPNAQYDYHTHINELGTSGRRLLGVAIRKAPTYVGRVETEAVVGLTFLGVLGFRDPIRASVPATLERIAAYGVRVIIATGDLKGTAIAVARELGWKVSDDEVLSGEELRNLSDEALNQALKRVRIFARVTPEDKLRVAKLLMAQGEVVAMTGDGVNDAPSLKAATIGVAVGSGSDVAKSVADLVLLDDNFETIVAAIEEGKRMLKNIKKIFVYLMSNSLDGVFLIGGSILVGLTLPLTAVQIIWVNLFTGSLPALAYAFDRDRELLPVNASHTNIFDRQVKFLTVGIGLTSSFFLFLLYWTLMQYESDVAVVKSVVFACFASYVLIISFSLRNLEKPLFTYPIFDNKLLVFGVGLGLVLLAATIYMPAFQSVFNTVAFPPVWLALVASWLVFNVALIELTKWILRPRSQSSLYTTSH